MGELGDDASVEVEGSIDDPESHEDLHGCPVTYSRGQRVVHVPRERYSDVLTALKDDGFEMCVDVTAVDYLTNPHRELPADVAPERFEVVASVRSFSRPGERLRVRVQVPESDPTVPTLFDLYPGTEFLEREVYDLMGIRFEGHPDLVRILMPDEWEGHPLRKDYSTGRIPVQFKGAPKPR